MPSQQVLDTKKRIAIFGKFNGNDNTIRHIFRKNTMLKDSEKNSKIEIINKLNSQTFFDAIKPEIFFSIDPEQSKIQIGDINFFGFKLFRPNDADLISQKAIKKMPIQIHSHLLDMSDSKDDHGKSVQIFGGKLFKDLVCHADRLCRFSHPNFTKALAAIIFVYVPNRANQKMDNITIQNFIGMFQKILRENMVIREEIIKYMLCLEDDEKSVQTQIKNLLRALKRSESPFNNDKKIKEKQLQSIVETLIELKDGLNTYRGDTKETDNEDHQVASYLKNEDDMEWVADLNLDVNKYYSFDCQEPGLSKNFFTYYQTYKESIDWVSRFVRTDTLHSFVFCWLASKYHSHTDGNRLKASKKLFNISIKGQKYNRRIVESKEVLMEYSKIIEEEMDEAIDQSEIEEDELITHFRIVRDRLKKYFFPTNAYTKKQLFERCKKLFCITCSMAGGIAKLLHTDNKKFTDELFEIYQPFITVLQKFKRDEADERDIDLSEVDENEFTINFEDFLNQLKRKIKEIPKFIEKIQINDELNTKEDKLTISEIKKRFVRLFSRAGYKDFRDSYSDSYEEILKEREELAYLFTAWHDFLMGSDEKLVGLPVSIDTFELPKNAQMDDTEEVNEEQRRSMKKKLNKKIERKSTTGNYPVILQNQLFKYGIKREENEPDGQILSDEKRIANVLFNDKERKIEIKPIESLKPDDIKDISKDQIHFTCKLVNKENGSEDFSIPLDKLSVQFDDLIKKTQQVTTDCPQKIKDQLKNKKVSNAQIIIDNKPFAQVVFNEEKIIINPDNGTTCDEIQSANTKTVTIKYSIDNGEKKEEDFSIKFSDIIDADKLIKKPQIIKKDYPLDLQKLLSNKKVIHNDDEPQAKILFRDKTIANVTFDENARTIQVDPVESNDESEEFLHNLNEDEVLFVYKTQDDLTTRLSDIIDIDELKKIIKEKENIKKNYPLDLRKLLSDKNIIQNDNEPQAKILFRDKTIANIMFDENKSEIQVSPVIDENIKEEFLHNLNEKDILFVYKTQGGEEKGVEEIKFSIAEITDFASIEKVVPVKMSKVIDKYDELTKWMSKCHEAFIKEDTDPIVKQMMRALIVGETILSSPHGSVNLNSRDLSNNIGLIMELVEKIGNPDENWYDNEALEDLQAEKLKDINLSEFYPLTDQQELDMDAILQYHYALCKNLSLVNNYFVDLKEIRDFIESAKTSDLEVQFINSTIDEYNQKADYPHVNLFLNHSPLVVYATKQAFEVKTDSGKDLYNFEPLLSLNASRVQRYIGTDNNRNLALPFFALAPGLFPSEEIIKQIFFPVILTDPKNIFLPPLGEDGIPVDKVIQRDPKLLWIVSALDIPYISLGEISEDDPSKIQGLPSTITEIIEEMGLPEWTRDASVHTYLRQCWLTKYKNYGDELLFVLLINDAMNRGLIPGRGNDDSRLGLYYNDDIPDEYYLNLIRGLAVEQKKPEIKCKEVLEAMFDPISNQTGAVLIGKKNGFDFEINETTIKSVWHKILCPI